MCIVRVFNKSGFIINVIRCLSYIIVRLYFFYLSSKSVIFISFYWILRLIIKKLYFWKYFFYDISKNVMFISCNITINIFVKDFIISVIKSVIFAWLIIWIGAYFGFKVRGGAEEVGKETTASVVFGIFVIIVADALFSFIYDIKF